MQSGDVQWDLVEITAPEYETAVPEGLLEPFDYDIISDKGLPGYAKAEYGIKYLSFLFVMAWDQKASPLRRPPRTGRRYSTRASTIPSARYNTTPPTAP